VIDVSNAEIKFDIGQFNDYYAKTKPTLYIKMSDVFAMHSLVANAVSSLCSSQEDNSLRDVLRELGSAKANEAEMSAGQAEVTLSLGGRMHTVEGTQK
jgi:Ras GTPase-activating-like protein IQGAP2/3